MPPLRHPIDPGHRAPPSLRSPDVIASMPSHTAPPDRGSATKPAATPTRLQSRAYAELRRLIVTGEFPPGTFLSERQLAQQLVMSKTPVHVALERLEAEGFV